jgi:hypothetical protein
VSRANHRTRAYVARIVRQCLQEGATVEIDGLGRFRRNSEGEYEFAAEDRPRVFLAYADEDVETVRRLFRSLKSAGLDPWLDKEKLLPGQNWPRAIERAIEMSDFFVACFSRLATAKRGHFQSELRYALDCAARLPLGRIFLIPARLDNCDVPVEIRRSIQYVDLFPDWEKGVGRVLAAIRRAMRSNGLWLRRAG